MLLRPVPNRFIDIDFETRSKLDIKKVGAWKYSEHKSTDALIMRYQIDEGKSHRWLLGDKPPAKLFRALRSGKYKIRAFNSFFEFCIWKNVCEKKYGWPVVEIEDFYCVQAEAQRRTFKGNLEDAAIDMGLDVRKDKNGKRLISMFSNPSRKQDEEWKEPHNYWKEFLEFDSYCDTDVKTQIGVSKYAGKLPEFEYNVFLLTERINAKGLPIDIRMAEGAEFLLKQAKEKLNEEFKEITGQDFNLTQTQKVRSWLSNNGLPLPNLQAKTVERALKSDKYPKKAKRALYLFSQSNKTSTSKYKSALELIASDGFIHGILKYHRASTGRWGAVGIQVQNFARPKLPKWVDYDYLAKLIAEKDYDHIEFMYGSVMESLSSALRSMICAPDGFKFIAADFAQIEARIAFWYAGEEDALDIFRTGGDIYCEMASDIFKFKVTKKNEYERFIGKQVILGLGFGMGWKKFKQDQYDKFDVTITAEFAKNAVNMYRSKYKKVKKAWSDVQKAAVSAVRHKGKRFQCLNGKASFIYDGIDLICTLASGREIYYHDPKIRKVPAPADWHTDEPIDELSYIGINARTHKWQREKTYGGSLFQSIVQGTARDLMAGGLLNAESEGYPTLFTVHDEGISMVPDKPSYTADHYAELLIAAPKWAKGIPIAADAWEGKRYRK